MSDKTNPVLPIQDIGLNKIATGTTASTAQLLNLLYRLLLEIQKMAIEWQGDQLATALAIANSEGEAVQAAGRRGADATETQGIGQVVGSSASLGFEAGGLGKAHFGAANKEIKNQQNLIDQFDSKKQTINDTLPADHVVSGNRADAAQAVQGQQAADPDFMPDDRQTFIREFKSDGPVHRKDGTPMNKDELKAAAGVMSHEERSDVLGALASRRDDAAKDRTSAHYRKQSDESLFRTLAQASNGLGTGPAGIVAADYQKSQANEEKTKALLQASQEMVRNTTQTSTSISEQMRQSMQIVQDVSKGQDQRA